MSHGTDRFDIRLSGEEDPQPAARLAEEEPYRIALLGDFSGRAQRDAVPQRRPLIVDPDNFESVMRRLRIELPCPGGHLPVTDLDDFHPDRIYSNAPVFGELRRIRERLEDPGTFVAAARELTGASTQARPRVQSGANLLEEMLGGPAAAAPARESKSDLQDFLDEAIGPYLEAEKDPRAPELIRSVDAAAAGIMRSVLHDDAFRSLESSWRSVWLLLQRLETGAGLKIYLYDLTAAELGRETQAIHDLLIRRSDPFSLMVGLYTFGTEDLATLASLGSIARKAGAPILAEAGESILGSGEWEDFRRLPQAGWVGLALPRVQLRLPYGKETDPIEAFAFEEVEGQPDVRQILYGNPAVFCAIAAVTGENSIGGLPVYTYKDEEGDARAFPSVEMELKESTAEALLDNGIIPIAGVRNTDGIRILRLQSAADAPAGLPLR